MIKIKINNFSNSNFCQLYFTYLERYTIMSRNSSRHDASPVSHCSSKLQTSLSDHVGGLWHCIGYMFFPANF